MCQEKPTYEELEARLAKSERALKAIKDGKIDTFVSEKGVYYLRLKDLKEALSRSRKQMEETEFTLDALMECIPEGITIADYPDVRIVRVSDFGKELLGKSNKELEGITLDQHVAKWDIYESDGYTKAKNENLPLTRAVIKGETIKNDEWILKTADGRSIPMLCNAAPIRNREGETIGGVIAWRDISELKKAEEKLRLMTETLEKQVAERTVDLKKRASQLVKLSSQLILTEQRERSRIAAILHDHLQQLMVAAKINQEVLIGRIDNELKPVAENVLDLINRSIRESRSLTTELSPPVLHSGDLSASLEWLARWMRENQGFEVKLHVEPEIVLDHKELSLMLFQSIRELLFNVLKHSGVKSAAVITEKKNGELQIIVSDQGVGFDPETVWDKSVLSDKFGLFSIHERVLHLGGYLEVESVPNEGSTISLMVPLDEKKSD
jgi:PAS domain S-box-containing protein